MSEYLPVALFSLILISETELEKHSLNTCCHFCIIITSIVLFYILMLRFKRSKRMAFTIALFFCITMVYIKNNYILNKRS